MAKKKKKKDRSGLLLAAVFGGLLLLPGLASAGDDVQPDDDDPDAPPPDLPPFADEPTRTDPAPGGPTGPSGPGGPSSPDKPSDGPTRTDPTGPTRTDPIDPNQPLGPFNPYTFIPKDPTPSQVDDIVRKYPTPSTFYRVVQGDVPTSNKGIATRYALSALHLAAREYGGMSVDQANAWAAARDSWDDSRKPAWLLIICAPINDARFGTYAAPWEGSNKTIKGPNGRGIRLIPDSAGDIDRIRAGQPMVRNIRLGKPGDSPNVSAEGVNPAFHEYPDLWLPGVDLKTLWESDGKIWQPGGQWGDGSSRNRPPPLIYALGVVDYTGASITQWGCEPRTSTVPQAV